MSVQHLLLSKNGENKIFEKEALEEQLVVSATLPSSAKEQVDGSADRRVAVNKHYYKGKYYAVAVERHAASNEIDDLIELTKLHPIDEIIS